MGGKTFDPARQQRDRLGIDRRGAERRHLLQRIARAHAQRDHAAIEVTRGDAGRVAWRAGRTELALYCRRWNSAHCSKTGHPRPAPRRAGPASSPAPRAGLHRCDSCRSCRAGNRVRRVRPAWTRRCAAGAPAAPPADCAAGHAPSVNADRPRPRPARHAEPADRGRATTAARRSPAPAPARLRGRRGNRLRREWCSARRARSAPADRARPWRERAPHPCRRHSTRSCQSATCRRRRAPGNASRAGRHARIPSTTGCPRGIPRHRRRWRRCWCPAAARSSDAWRRRPTTGDTGAKTAVRRGSPARVSPRRTTQYHRGAAADRARLRRAPPQADTRRRVSASATS